MKVNLSFFNNTILDFYRSCSNCWYSEVFATIVVHFSSCSIQRQYLRIEYENTMNWPNNFNVTRICPEIAHSVTITGHGVLWVNLRAEPPFVFLSEAEKEGHTWIASSLWSRHSPNLWTSQSGPLPSYKFCEYKHPFVEKPMVITEPAVQCKRPY